MLFDLSVEQTLPFFGVVPAILNESGEELEGESEGYLVRWIPFLLKSSPDATRVSPVAVSPCHSGV